MTNSEKYLWGSEEFEDCVSRGLLAMYETKLEKHCASAPEYCRALESDLQKVRNMGCYFSSPDRIIDIGGIDLINDGLPDRAVYSYAQDLSIKREDSFNEYLTLYYCEKVDRLPKEIRPLGSGQAYKLITFLPTSEKGLIAQKQFFKVNRQDGSVTSTYFMRSEYDGVKQTFKKVHCGIDIRIDENGKPYELDVLKNAGIITLNAYQDRRYLWNVTAKEQDAKATFSVYPEEVKSLFYARELPLTETGRKRPILHWVNAHQRRLKKGIEIDIDKHLRGSNTFVYKGTEFIITRPLKENKQR